MPCFFGDPRGDPNFQPICCVMAQVGRLGSLNVAGAGILGSLLEILNQNKPEPYVWPPLKLFFVSPPGILTVQLVETNKELQVQLVETNKELQWRL